MNYILTLSCPDRKGIVAKICSFLAENQGFILELAQFSDPDTHLFFMRTLFELGSTLNLKRFKEKFSVLEKEFSLNWNILQSDYKHQSVLLVSKEGHCLNHLLYQAQNNLLPIHIKAVISNHTLLEKMVQWYQIPFIYLPVTSSTKQKQQKQLKAHLEKLNPDLVVLARYMQILPSVITEKFYGKMINIHHSFLPSFKGARPYLQAYQKGVKLIGATAHYVTGDLDEGPIIEQEIDRIDHTFSSKKMIVKGKDIECRVLSSAIKWHAEQKVFINRNKTVVFR